MFYCAHSRPARSKKRSGLKARDFGRRNGHLSHLILQNSSITSLLLDKIKDTINYGRSRKFHPFLGHPAIEIQCIYEYDYYFSVCICLKYVYIHLNYLEDCKHIIIHWITQEHMWFAMNYANYLESSE